MNKRVFRCVLSGSYHKDRDGLLRAYDELIAYGCQVLSPHRLDFNVTETLFVRDKAEHETPAETIERHHLLSIKQSDFMWLHAPNGYVGLSAAMEIGYAVAHNIPIYSHTSIADASLEPFIISVASVYQGLARLDD